MIVIRARNVHDALPEALWQMRTHAVARSSRNGLVAVMPDPVTIVYERPTERVMFHPERDANPFFHFYEGLWMLGGRNDVASLTRFVGKMGEYSDDGETFRGAYGHRWRRHFGGCMGPIDQLKIIGTALRRNHDDRRQVLQIFDAATDLAGQEKLVDIPCNIAVHFQVRDVSLDMTVFNRSNDVIWGACGANAVHFSMLQEFMAALVGIPVGRYWQVSDNFHAYVEQYEKLVETLADRAFQPYRIVQWTSPYEHEGPGAVTPFNMVNGPVDVWLEDLEMFLDEEGGAMGYRDPFFRRVALPMMAAHTIYKGGDGLERFTGAKAAAKAIGASDWRRAAIEWIQRREAQWKEKQDGQSKSSD